MKQFLFGFKGGMREFGNNITVLVNFILLTFVYVLGIGLVSVVAIIFKKSFLDTKILKDKKTYWQDLDLKKEPTDNYFRQF